MPGEIFDARLYIQLPVTQTGKTDYFTKSDEYPKTFKIAKCEAPDVDHANLKSRSTGSKSTARKKTRSSENSTSRPSKPVTAWLIA